MTKSGTDPFVRQTFAALFGSVLGIALLKFPNPPIMRAAEVSPSNAYEWLLTSWPLSIGYFLVAATVVFGFVAGRRCSKIPRWFVVLPALWLVWQFVAATQSRDASLTSETLKHFAACLACYYLGLFSLSTVAHLRPFWLGLLGGFVIVLAAGWQQHFGGLDETRRHFYTYIYPNLETQPSPEFLKRIESNRIFSTLFYPNSLAGAVLLLLPVSTGVALQRISKRALSLTVAGSIGIAALACLVWSGSKGGWLVLMVLTVIVFLRTNLSRGIKLTAVGVLLVAGFGGFIWKYSAFFQRGATSVVARFDYWQAGLKIIVTNPVLGTGPGTFGPAYSELRKPESEPARLAHNDYLQQATDSGVPGFLFYSAFIGLVLAWTARRVWRAKGLEAFGLWLGLLGWSLHCVIEFGLYIPALAWPACAMMGLLVGRTGNRLDTPQAET